MKKLAVVVVILVAAWWLWPDGKRYPPGVLVKDDPQMTLVQNGPSWTYRSKDRDYTLTAQAKYSAKARVLSINTDYGDTLIGPMDITIGWGPMSDQAVLDRLKIWQDNTRHWYVQPRGDWPIPMGEVGGHAVNTHIIPATTQIETDLKGLGKGDLIAIEGQLVNVRRDDGFHWNTSVDPFGFGDHSCKIIWVESFRRI